MRADLGVVLARLAVDNAASYLGHVVRDPNATAGECDAALRVYREASDRWLAALRAARGLS